MRLRITSLTVATLCGLAWLSPVPCQAMARSFGPPPAPPKPPAATNQGTPATTAMPPSPCSAWSNDRAVLIPAPTVCRSYISSKGNALLKLEEPILSKVPQDPEIVGEFAGVRGDTATAEFEIDEPSQVQLVSDSDFLIAELRYGPMSRESVIRLPKFNTPGTKTQVIRRPGTYYLNVRADGSWRAKISLLSREYRYDYDIAASSELVNPTEVPVLITYSFGEGAREEITLNPGQRLPISGNIALSDYTEPRTPEQLREDFPGLLIHEVENVSKAAVLRRQEKTKKARQAKLDPAKTRKAARSELQHSAISVQARNKRQRFEAERSLAEQAANKDRRWKRRWGTAGVLTMVAGVGAGTALMVVGGTRLPEAKDALAAAKAERAKMGDSPSPNIEVEIGRRSRDVSNAQTLLTSGILVAGLGLAVGAVFFVVANRPPSRNRSTYSFKLAPHLAPGYAGAGASLKF